MAKRKRRAKKRPVKRPSGGIRKALSGAMADFENGEIEAARSQLFKLVAKHPQNKAVLQVLIDVALEGGDWPTYAYYGERVYPMEHGDEQAGTLNNLILAHTQMTYPALAWHFARQIMTQHPDFGMRDQIEKFIEMTEPFLIEDSESWDELAHLTQPEKLALMAKHDRVRFYTESGHFQDAIPIAEEVLAQAPNVVAIINNLSLARFAIGEVTQAMADAQRVLTLSPDNAHALGNLVRFTFLSGQFETAQQYADRLGQIAIDQPDLLTKLAESYAYLGNDAGVIDAYERARKIKGFPPHPLLLHLAAAAYFRRGDQKRAWKVWRNATKQAPGFEMAQACLAERWLPVGEQEVPWYWSFPYWGIGDLQSGISAMFDGSHVRQAALKETMQTFLAERPYLPELFRHMLEKGDQATREFVLNFARFVNNPELITTIFAFALGPYGTDQLRMEALHYIRGAHPHMLPDNKQVTVWVNGEQKEIFLLAFEITNEPTRVEGVPDDILDKYEQAYDLMVNDEFDTAEPLLREIINEAPNFSSAYNNLAIILERQGKPGDAHTLMKETHARFPDYLFARVGLARMLVKEGQVEEAKDMLDPVMRQTQLHISEFRALARAQMDIALADKVPDAARAWLSMWRQIEEDNPELLDWEIRLSGPGQLLDKLRKLGNR